LDKGRATVGTKAHIQAKRSRQADESVYLSRLRPTNLRQDKALKRALRDGRLQLEILGIKDQSEKGLLPVWELCAMVGMRSLPSNGFGGVKKGKKDAS